jgi:hypothetical protein
VLECSPVGGELWVVELWVVELWVVELWVVGGVGAARRRG